MADISDYRDSEDWDDVDTNQKTPEGEYRFKIDNVEIRDNKNNNGNHFLFELTITAPTYEGSKEWYQINKENPSDDAVQIGKEQFKQMYLACGMDEPPSKTEEFVGNHIQATVVHNDNGYTDVKNPREDEGEPSGPNDSASGSSEEDDDIPF